MGSCEDLKEPSCSTYVRKKPKYQIQSKSVQCESSCSMRADGRTDMTKFIVAFRNVVRAPKTDQLLLYREISAV